MKSISLDDLNCCSKPKTRLVIFPYHVLFLCFNTSLSHSYLFKINLSPTAVLLSISFYFSYVHNIQTFHASSIFPVRYSNRLQFSTHLLQPYPATEIPIAAPDYQQKHVLNVQIK
jgi:hypothetical protein